MVLVVNVYDSGDEGGFGRDEETVFLVRPTKGRLNQRLVGKCGHFLLTLTLEEDI